MIGEIGVNYMILPLILYVVSTGNIIGSIIHYQIIDNKLIGILFSN